MNSVAILALGVRPERARASRMVGVVLDICDDCDWPRGSVYLPSVADRSALDLFRLRLRLATLRSSGISIRVTKRASFSRAPFLGAKRTGASLLASPGCCRTACLNSPRRQV